MHDRHRGKWNATAFAGIVGATLALLTHSFGQEPAEAQDKSAQPTRFTRSESIGTVSIVPGTATPSDCIRAAKEVCTFEVRGSEASSAYDGPGELSEHITIDYTQPSSSAAGVCFPQIGIGTMRTSRGEFNFFNQGEGCTPPTPAAVPPGFGNGLLHSAVTGGTGQFRHAMGTLLVTSVSHAPMGVLYHTIGAFVGLEPTQ